MSTSLRSRLAKPWGHERTLTAVLVFLEVDNVVCHGETGRGMGGGGADAEAVAIARWRTAPW